MINLVLVDEFVISTANYVPGFKIIETKGFAYGLTVRSHGSNEKMVDYVKMVEQTRDEALGNLIEHGKEMGANGLISVKFDSNDIAHSMQEVLAYGTAVVLEKSTSTINFKDYTIIKD